MFSINIQDVAKAAGVSVATVSRVLNGLAGVRPETAGLVLQKAEELGYTPNLLGRHLRKNETKTILVMASTVSNTFVAKVINAIEEEGHKNGYSILICATNDDPQRENAHLNLLRHRFADGMIIMSSVMEAGQMKALGRLYPIVQCCEYISGTGVAHVAIDNKKAAYDMTRHLIENGRKRIAYLGVKNNFISSRDRYAGYAAALAEAGLELDRGLVSDGNYGFRSALEIMRGVFEKGLRPDALFSISDRMAAGAVRAAKDKGIRIPEDIAITGFDNADISYISDPSITTVSQSPSEMGTKAMQLMMKRLSGETNIKSVTIKHEIIRRASA